MSEKIIRQFFVLSIIFLFVSPAQSQQFSTGVIDGPANIRQDVDGKILLSLNDNTNVDIISFDGKWYLIGINTIFAADIFSENKIIKKDIGLHDPMDNEIGKTLSDINISDQWKQNVANDRLSIRIEAYTHKANIKYIKKSRKEIGRHSLGGPFESNDALREYGKQVSDVYASWQGPHKVVEGSWGTDAGQFGFVSGDPTDGFPTKFLIDNNNNIIIADSFNKRVQIIGNNGAITQFSYKDLNLDWKILQWPSDRIGVYNHL